MLKKVWGTVTDYNSPSKSKRSVTVSNQGATVDQKKLLEQANEISELKDMQLNI